MKTLTYLALLCLLTSCSKKSDSNTTPTNTDSVKFAVSVPANTTYNLSYSETTPDGKQSSKLNITGGSQSKTYAFAVNRKSGINADWQFIANGNKAGTGSLIIYFNKDVIYTSAGNSQGGSTYYNLASK